MYKIITTLGPASSDEAIWEALIQVGATSFRLNTSHLSTDELSVWLSRLQRFLNGHEKPIPVILDLQGSKWRLGVFRPFLLEQGETITFIYGEGVDRPGFLPVPHIDFFKAAGYSNGEIMLNDARTHLRLKACGTDWLTASVKLGGTIFPKKGITYTSANYRQEKFGLKDCDILKSTADLDVIQYAISYVKDHIEMENLCQAMKNIQNGKKPHELIAKLERQPAVDQVEVIAKMVSEVWLCRGDLGAELGIKGMAEATNHFSKKVVNIEVPIMLAGQVLEHMVTSQTPTRAEICGLYDAIACGYKGIVLSDETAIGRFPVESCRAAAMFR